MNSKQIIERYEVMYTKDVHKKQKIWNDGWLRFYSHNSAVSLLDRDSGLVVASSFQNKVKLRGLLALPEEIEFEKGFLAQVGELESTTESVIWSKSKESKTETKERIKSWTTDFDKQDSSIVSSTSRLSSTVKGKERQPEREWKKMTTSENGSTSAYKGFSIAPPKSYHLAQAKLAEKDAKLAKREAREEKISNYTKNRPSPYSRPSSTPSNNTPIRKSTHNPLVPINSISKVAKATPSKGIGSPFKPPSFHKPSPLPSRLAQSLQPTSASKSNLYKIATSKQELEEEFQRFNHE